MARALGAAVGLDIGYHTLKAVLLQRKGGKLHLTGYSTRVLEERTMDPAQLGHHVKLLLSDMGGSAKAICAAYGGADVIMRIIDQPPTATDMLRAALKLGGQSILHQDTSGYVLDCDMLGGIPEPVSMMDPNPAPPSRQPYLVAGVPRPVVSALTTAFAKGGNLRSLQVAPVSLLNAFEMSQPDAFAGDSWLLLDIGHQQSTVLVGGRRELRLVRSIDYGGSRLLRDLTMNDAMDRQSAITLASQGDAGMIQACRDSLGMISREVLSSIGYYEGRFDKAVNLVHLSGGPAQIPMVTQVLNELINMPCEPWNAASALEVSLSKHKRESFANEATNLNVAIGAAAELLAA